MSRTEESARYREKNKELLKQKDRDYYQRNKERAKEKSMRWRETNYEEWKGQRTKLYSTNYKARLRRLVSSSKLRAKSRELFHELTPEWAIEQWEIQDGRCAQTKVPFELETKGRGHRHAFSPSIDRKDSTVGYTEDNSQLVCFIYNTAKMNNEHEDVLKFAEALVNAQKAHT